MITNHKLLKQCFGAVIKKRSYEKFLSLILFLWDFLPVSKSYFCLIFFFVINNNLFIPYFSVIYFLVCILMILSYDI